MKIWRKSPWAAKSNKTNPKEPIVFAAFRSELSINIYEYNKVNSWLRTKKWCHAAFLFSLREGKQICFNTVVQFSKESRRRLMHMQKVSKNICSAQETGSKVTAHAHTCTLLSAQGIFTGVWFSINTHMQKPRYLPLQFSPSRKCLPSPRYAWQLFFAHFQWILR